MNTFKKTVAILLAAATLSPIAAMAHHNGEYVKDPLGHAVAASAATRSVTIDEKTRSINVNQGDVVQFNIGGQTFAWQFDTLGEGRIDLATIAPTDVHVHGVNVFVEANPVYRN